MGYASPELTRLLQTRLLEFLRKPELDRELRDVAAFGALPLYWDVGGCVAIRPDGTVVSVYWAQPEASFREADANWRTVALVAGREQYPELEQLVPARPPSAIDCDNCSHRGRLEDDAFCGVCHGLGWIVAS
jgi:hypothetical protein